MALTANATTKITQLYVAMFGRAPDNEGLNFWGGALDAGQSVAKVAQDMFATTPARAYFPEGATNQEIVQAFYVNVLGRQPDAEGLTFWTNRLEGLKFTGTANAVGQVVAEILAIVTNYQGSDPAGQQSAQLFANKIEVANFWVSENGSADNATKPIALVNADPASVNQVKAQILNGFGDIVADTTFTLKEVYTETTVTVGPEMERVIMWGYNPHAHGETGVDNLDGDNPDGNDNNLTNEGPADGGVPVEYLYDYLETVAGLDFVQLGLIDVVDEEFPSLEGVDFTNNGDGTQTITVTLPDGRVNTAEVALSESYFKLVYNALFDSEGNSRLYEVVRAVTNEDGTVDGGEQVTVRSYEPIKLTPSVNNGGTVEQGYTTAGDDTIVAGRLDLLHGAYIDGGAGYNTLEVDAKGTYAQPLAVLNVQEIQVQNLPNVYTTGEGGEGYLGDSTYPDLSNDYQGNLDSVLDLSRALDVEKLVVTEGNGTGAQLGDLTIVGVRNGATLRLEGGFTEDVTVHYGEGLTGPLTVELLLGQVTGDLNFVHNTDALHLVSLGGVANSFGSEDIGGRLTHLKISGDAALYINGDLDGSFQDETPITIDASANTKGVDLTLTGSEKVTFIGTQGDDSFKVATDDAGDLIAGIPDDSVTITDTSGNNHYGVESTTIDITVGNGNNNIELEGQFAEVVAGNGDNAVVVAEGFETIAVTVGGGDNTINTDDSAVVVITAGNGANSISSVRGESVTVVAGNGGNTVTVSAEVISITTGSGNDTIVVSGMGDTDIGGDANVTGLLNIDTGAGTNTVVLGRDLSEQTQFGITALEGSSITGENITLRVENLADLRAAELSGIDNVVLNYDISSPINGNVQNYGLDPVLTLTDTQFLAIGAANFAVQGAVFSNYAQVKIIVTQSTSLTALGVNALPRNIDLQLELQDGVTLTMTAEQLHTKVAPEGITLDHDNNTDYAAGKVVITGGGLDFDPFNTNDTVKTNIGGNIYYGGSLSEDFKVDGQWYNVKVNSLVNGWDRPADVPSEVVITLDSGTGIGSIDQGAFASWHTNLEIVGEKDINFTGAIQLGMDAGVPTNPFTIDFSTLEAEVHNFTVDNFELLGQGGGIFGNSNNGYESEVLISLAADEGVSGTAAANAAPNTVGFDEAEAGSLVSQGVSKYTVVVIDGPTANGSLGNHATIKLCDTAQDIEVFALRGNYNDTLNIIDAAWGLVFELQGGGTAKAEGPTGTSNVGALVANYEWDGADAVVNLVHSVAGDVRPLYAAGIEINNADSITINADGPSAIIEEVAGDSAEELVLTADGGLSIVTELPDALESIDASGVVGNLSVTIEEPTVSGVTFVGAAGSTTLELHDIESGDIASIAGAGDISLVIGDADGSWAADDEVDLSATSLTNVTTVTLTDGSELTLTIAQAGVIGAANFILADGDNADLVLTNLDSTLFVRPAFNEDINVAVVSVAPLPTVTLNAGTDLTDIGSLAVHEGTTLNLTAAQFQQLAGTGTITGVTTNDFVINITGLTAADVAGGFSLAGIPAGVEVNLQLAESVDLSGATLTGVDSITFGDDITLTLGDVQQANGVAIVGGANSVLKFTDTASGAFESTDASGFDVSELHMLNVLIDGRNIDLLFSGLAQSITKVIYNDLGWVEGVTQTVSIVGGTTVPGFVVFNKPEDDVEIRNFVLNLQGGTEIEGNLRLSASEKDSDLIQTHLQSVVINSSGTSANLLTGSTANVITGSITSQGTGNQGTYTSVDNNLLDITINATQALVVEGSVVFESVTGDDDVTANDNEEAVASLVINGTADVSLGALDTSDSDVDGLNVVNNSTGTLTAVLDGNLQQADDALSFTGTGDIELIIENEVDLSGDVLTSVTEITINDGGDLVLTQAQFNVLGAANIVDGETDGAADLNLVEFVGAVAFDATALDSDITIESITMAEGAQVLNAATNLTGVESINVPAGGTLTLTAAQFQQLANDGDIDALGAGANLIITGLTQADVDAGFDLSDVDGFESVTITLGEASVDLGTFVDGALVSGSDAVIEDAQFILADGQTLGLVNFDQADGLVVDGGANTTLVYKFVDLLTSVVGPVQIDASGYDVTVLKALAASFTVTPDINVEFAIDDLPSSVELRLYADPSDLGFLDPTFRRVVIEEGVTVGVNGLIFNDWDTDDEVRTLELTLEGDATLTGDLAIPTRTNKDGDLVQQFFSTLTINSVGTAANLISGDITTASTPIIAPTTAENSLLNVVINATQDLVIDGDIAFNSVGTDGTADTATLTLTGTADVTIDHLDITNTVNDDIGTLAIVNNLVGGTLTVLGGTPAVQASSSFETLTITGTGSTVLGVDPDQSDEDGIDSATLSVIDASGSSGVLTIGTMVNIDSESFTFTSGTGVTKVWLDDDQLDEDVPADTGWSFNFANAAVGSELHIGSNVDYWEGQLTFNMGANGTLYIDNTDGAPVTVDLTDNEVFLSYTGANAIVLGDGVTLVLRADQANGLNIVAGANTTDDGDPDNYTGVVNIVGLDNDVVYDFGGIVPAGTITLAENDVTVETATDLGTFSITLTELDNTSATLAGQTIRFNTEAQATRDIIVNEVIGNNDDSSTNVVWLFNSIVAAGGIDTSGYDSALGRLWFYADLLAAEGGDVEQLFTTLPSTILRVDVEDLAELNVLLQSQAVDRVMEIVHFATVGDLTFSDMGVDPEEHLNSLTLHLGGQTTVGNIMVNDVVADPVNTDLTTIDFTELTIVSHRAVRTGDLLASELYVNDNDATVEYQDESGVTPDTTLPHIPENARPNNINTVGNIGVGAGNSGIDLVQVNIDTLGLTVLDGGAAGNGANIEIGTITFGYTPGVGDPLTTGVTLDVTGANDITIASVVATDADIAGPVVVDATGFSGTLTAPGTSPGIQLGAAVEVLEIIGDQAGAVINLGSADVLNPNAGVTGAGLSQIDASAYVGELNLGILALIDGTNDDSTPLTPANDGLVAAFELTAGSGITTATLGQDPDSANVPTLAAGSEWIIDFTNAAAGSQLTITDEVVFGTPALPGDPLPLLTLLNVDLHIQGDVDLTGVDLSGIDSASDIFVAAGNSLTITPAQAEALAGGVRIEGEGTVFIAGDASDTTVVGSVLSLWPHIRTVNVDLSGVTISADVLVDADQQVEVDLHDDGAIDDDGAAVGYNVVGSANADYIEASDLDDTIDGAGGDDSLEGMNGNDTFLVTAGTDTIVDLLGEADDLNALTTEENDVLVVSAGATAVATTAEFIATAATVNNGTANLSTNGGVINVALAGGSSGFNLTGGLLADTLVGSALADVIVGGGDNQAAGVFDTLTGNGGADTFRFVTSTSTPQTLSVEVLADGAPNLAGIDWERINVTVGADGDGGTVTIPYSINGVVAATPISVVLAGNATTTDVASAIAAAFNTAGFTTALVNAGESVEVRGANGVQLEFGVIDYGTSGITVTYAEGTTNVDQAQVTRIQLSDAAAIVAGETYTLNITLLGTSTNIQVSYTALIGDDWDDVTQGLETKITDLGGGAISAANGSGGGEYYLDITDVVADNGGFSVTVSSTGGFDGSSASDTNANDWNSSDLITDFLSGTDKVDFQGLAAGSLTNYAEAAEVADYATALADANTAFNGTVRYYLTSVTDIDSVTVGNQASGVLFFDADADGTVDGAVRLTGISSANFAHTDIIASV